MYFPTKLCSNSPISMAWSPSPSPSAAIRRRFSAVEAAAGGYHGHASQVYGPLTMSPGISDETVTRFVAGCGGLEWAGLMVVWSMAISGT